MEKKNHAYKFSGKLKEKCNARLQNVCEAVRAAETGQTAHRTNRKTDSGWHTQRWDSSGKTSNKTVLKGKRLNLRHKTIPVFSMGPENGESRADIGNPVGTEWQDAPSLRHQTGNPLPVTLEGYPCPPVPQPSSLPPLFSPWSLC